MIARLRSNHIALLGLGSALSAITACSSPEAGTIVRQNTKQTTQAASVLVEVLDAKGALSTTCSGTLIAPKMVLTAGHCVAGASSWKVTAKTGASTASVASTPWKNFNSDLSHPEHSDVGFILLNDAIKLDRYPQLSSTGVKDGSTGVRFHRADANSKELIATKTTVAGGASRGFRLNYLVDMAGGEFLDTGGALFDDAGQILGVVSGRGKTSNLLHIARVDGFATFSKSAASCSSAIAKRSWGTGNAANGGGGYGGAPASGGGNAGSGDPDLGSSGGWGSSSGGTGGTGGYGGSGGLGSGDDGSNAGSDGTMGASDRVPGATGGQGEPSGAPPAAGTSDGRTPSGGAANSDGIGDASDAKTCPGIPACQGSSCGAGSDGNNGGTGAPSASSAAGSDGSAGVGGTPAGGSEGTGESAGEGSGEGTGEGGTGEGGEGAGSDGNTGNNANTGTGTTGSAGSDGNTGATSATTGSSAPDSATCSGPNCGGCGTNMSCIDPTIDYGRCLSCAMRGPIVN